MQKPLSTDSGFLFARRHKLGRKRCSGRLQLVDQPVQRVG